MIKVEHEGDKVVLHFPRRAVSDRTSNRMDVILTADQTVQLADALEATAVPASKEPASVPTNEAWRWDVGAMVDRVAIRITPPPGRERPTSVPIPWAKAAKLAEHLRFHARLASATRAN